MGNGATGSNKMPGKRISDKAGKRRSNKEIRKATFAELEANGRLDVPLYRKPKVDEMVVVKNGKLVKKKVDLNNRVCCIDKYQDDLPRWFRPCADCFRETETDDLKERN
jgi:hypothetical protein